MPRHSSLYQTKELLDNPTTAIDTDLDQLPIS